MGSISPLRARSVRSTENRFSASCLPMAAGAMAPLASPGAAPPPRRCRRWRASVSSGDAADNLGELVGQLLHLDLLELPRDAQQDVLEFRGPEDAHHQVAGADLILLEQQRAVHPAPLTASSRCGERSEMDVEPRGSLSSAAVMSAARRDGLISKRRMMRCRSESCNWRI